MLCILLAEEDNFVGAEKYQRGNYFFVEAMCTLEGTACSYVRL